MYYEYTQENLRAYCRNCIETFEIWARRFIHEIMLEQYGADYLYAKLPNGDYIISKNVRKQVEKMLEKEPERFQRKIDTLFVENIIDVLCNEKLYRDLFGRILLTKYPEGKEELRTFLNRIAGVRNYLSHANPISIRQSEQVICYSHDFIDCLKEYYKTKGEEKMWNVPRIIKITDSFGNVFDNIDDKGSGSTIHNIPQTVRCGDTYTVYLELDSSFSSNEYDIVWKTNKELTQNRNNPNLTYTFATSDVSSNMYIRCEIISHKEWHKYHTYDCEVFLHLQVLPPIE